MSNLTISVDEELIRKARVRAIQEGTSVSAKLREFLLHYVNGTPAAQKSRQEDATDALLAAIEAARLQAHLHQITHNTVRFTHTRFRSPSFCCANSAGGRAPLTPHAVHYNSS